MLVGCSKWRTQLTLLRGGLQLKVETMPLSHENVTLTAYVLDQSNEMRNVNIRPAILIFPGGGYHICGFSAGGHLAAALGTMGRVKPNALILGYPCILESMSSIFPYPVSGMDKAVSETTPPAFIFHTANDALVPVENAIAFASALDHAKIPFELHIFQNGKHGLSLARPLTSSGFKHQVNTDVANWFRLSVAWLTNLFGDFDAKWESVMDEVITVYNVDAAFGKLWENPDCRKVILEELPWFANVEGNEERMKGVALRVILNHIGEAIPLETIVRLNDRLSVIPVQ